MEPPILPSEKPVKSTLFHSAASASLVAPLLAVVLGGVSHSVEQAPGASRIAMLAFGGMIFIFILMGFICGVVALSGIHHHGTKKLLGRGLAGVVVNGLLLLLFTTNFIAARDKAITNQRGFQEVKRAVASYGSNTGNAYNPTTGLDANAVSKQMGELSASLNEASRNMSGNDAQIAQALAACVAKWDKTQKEFNKSLAEFDPDALIRFKTLEDKGQIEQRRQVVTNFLRANENMRAFVLGQESQMQDELRSRSIPTAMQDSFMVNFRKGRVVTQGKVMEIRDCDKEFCETILKLLDLAESQWGQWHFDEADNKIIFNDDTAAEQFTQLHEQIQSIGRKEVQLQGELIEFQRQYIGSFTKQP